MTYNDGTRKPKINTTMTNDTTENLHEAAAKGHTETLMEMLDKRIADYEFDDSWPIYEFPAEYPVYALPRREKFIIELLVRYSSN